MLWGVYFGVLLILEKLFLLKWLKNAPRWTAHLYTMFLVLISWVIFAFDNLSAGLSYVQAMFGMTGAGLADGRSLYLLYTSLPMLVILFFASMDWGKRLLGWISARLKPDSLPLALAQNAAFAGILLLSVAYLVDASYNPFLYFRF